jgi:hypothetical protein
MNLNKSQILNYLIIISSFWAAVIVGISKFLSKSWVENNFGETIKQFLIKILNFIDFLSKVIRENVEEKDE